MITYALRVPVVAGARGTCGTPNTFTGAPAPSPAAMAASPAGVVMSIGLTVITPLLRSTWYTSVAEPMVVLTSTVTGSVPPATLIANVLAANAVLTAPSGSGVGTSTASRTYQPLALLPPSPQVATLSPQAGSAPTVPPKLMAPPAASAKLVVAPLPKVTVVGKVKSHHLKPVSGLPLSSNPFVSGSAM